MASAFDKDRERLGLLGNKKSSTSAFDADRIKLGLMKDTKKDSKDKTSSPTNLVLTDTLKSVMKPVAEEKKTVDFKAAQAAAKTKEETTKPVVKETQGVDFAAAQSKDKPKTLQGAVPAASLLTGSLPSALQTNLKNKVPAASLLNETGGGPANASQIPGISQYEINKQYIAENANPIVKPYSNVMNYLNEGNPIGIAVNNAFSGNSGVTRKDSSGNATVDKASEIINNLVTPFITPTGAPSGEGIIGSTYKATGKALSGKFGQKILSGAEKIIPGSQNVVKTAATEALAGGMQGAAFGLQQGQDSGNEIAHNALLGTAAGGVLGGVGAAVGEAFPALLSRFRKSGIADDEIAEIAPELLALPEAQPRTIRKQQAGEIKTTTSSDPIATPYTFKIGEATPETQAATANRQSLRSTDPVELSTRYAQEVIDEYKTLKQSPKKMSNKKLYDLARDNVDARRPVDATTVESKLKDTRINGEAVPYKEPVIRDPQTVSREQAIINKGKNITQEDIDFALSDQWDNAKLFPESVPTESTYVKPTPKPVEVKPTPIKTAVKAKSSVKSEVAATAELQPAKKLTIVTDVKTPIKSLAEAKKKATPGIRANFKTMTDSDAISSTLKGKIDDVDKTYNIVKDVDAVRAANEHVKDLDIAESKFKANEYDGKESIATGYRIAIELDKKANAATNEEIKKALFGRSLDVMKKVAADLTKAGQTAQAGSLISRLSPEGQLQNLIRTAKENGLEVSVADSAKFKQEAAKALENSNAGKTENAITDILNRLEQGGASPDDIKALGDYLKTAEGKIKPKPKGEVVDRLPKEMKDVRTRDKVVSFLEAQEAAAQARINKRRGRMNSLPVEEWIDYSIIISSKVAKGIIKAETYVEDLVKLFGEDIKPIAREVFEKAQELIGSVTKGSMEGDFIKADNAFKRITGKSSLNQQERIVEKYVAANPEVTPKDIEALRKLSKSLTELRGTDKIKADIEMQKILNSYEKSSINDKINAVRYISMLFNDSTQAINALSGPIMATWGSTIDVLGTMMDIAMRGTLKTQRSTTLYGTNPIRFIANYFKYAKVGGKAGWEGVNPSGIQGTNEIRGLAFKSKKNPLGIAERSLGAVAKGADYATYRTVYDSELQKQGFLDALENGIKRSDKTAIKQHVRKFMNDPPLEAIEQADRIGKNTTFQRNDSVGGKTANWINASPKLVKPFVNAVVPFVRTPLNIASTAITATPVGIIKGLFQLSSLSKASQREAIRTLSMGITGGVGMTSLGYYLSSVGIITGANDTGNKDRNSINDQAGRSKYRFNTSALKRYMTSVLNGEGADAAEKAAKYKEGDKQFDYNKLQPLAFPLAMGAGYQEKKGSVGEKFSSAGTQAYGSLYGMSSLRGVQDVFQPQYTGTQGDKAIGSLNRVIESYIKSFSPSMLAQETRRADPIQRQTAYNEGIKKDVTDYYKSRIPGLSTTLPAKRDTLGNVKVYPEGIVGQHLNPYKSEVANYSTAAELIADLIDRTGDDSIAPSAPKKYFTKDYVRVDIPQARYEKLQTDMGDEITKRIIEIESGTDEEMIQQITDIYKEVKDEFMDEVKAELGD